MSIIFICTVVETKMTPTVLVWCRLVRSLSKTRHFLYLVCHLFKVRKGNLSQTTTKPHTHLFPNLLWGSANFKRLISQRCLHRVQPLDNEPCNKSLRFLPSQTEQGAAEGSTKSCRVATVGRARCQEWGATASPTAGQMVRRQNCMFVIHFRVPFHPACIHRRVLSPHTITT